MGWLSGPGAGSQLREGALPLGRLRRAIGVGRTDDNTKPSSTRRAGGCSARASSALGAGELIAELVLALKMGAEIEDVAMTVHPHPTLSETVGLAAEAGAGTITGLPKRRVR